MIMTADQMKSFGNVFGYSIWRVNKEINADIAMGRTYDTSIRCTDERKKKRERECVTQRT